MIARFWLLFVAMSLIWGASFLWIKIALEEISPLALATCRIALGVIGLIVLCAFRRVKIPWKLRTWMLFLAPAILNSAIPFALISWAETRISSGMASILNGTVPLFTFVLAHFCFHDERMTLKRAIGLFCGFIGVIVLAGKDLLSAGHENSLAGVGAMILAVLCYALGNIYAKKYLRGQPALVTSMLSLTLALALILPVLLATEHPVHWPMRGRTWFALSWLGFLGLSTAYVMYYYLLDHFGPSRVSTVAYVFPFIGMLLGIVFLNEHPTWHLAAGATLIVAGLWIVNHGAVRVSNAVPGVRDNTIMLKRRT